MKKTYTVLIAEDELSWQRTFKRCLQNEPLVISCATTYQEALTLIKNQNFDLVILDVNLTEVPGNYDGLRIANELWKKNKRTRIIIISGSEGLNRRSVSYAFVPTYTLKKQNFDKDELVEKIQSALTQPTLWD